MKKCCSFLILLVLSLSAKAQGTPAECFTGLDFGHTFFALDTHSESDLASWYQDTFGMEILKQFESEDKTTRGVILQKNHLYIEILYHSRKGEDLSMQPTKEGRGIKKTGIFIDRPVEELKSCLDSKKVKTGRIFHDREMGFKLLHLVDPEGNELEILSKS